MTVAEVWIIDVEYLVLTGGLHSEADTLQTQIRFHVKELRIISLCEEMQCDGTLFLKHLKKMFFLM